MHPNSNVVREQCVVVPVNAVGLVLKGPNYTLLPPTGLASLSRHFQLFLCCCGDREIVLNNSSMDGFFLQTERGKKMHINVQQCLT